MLVCPPATLVLAVAEAVKGSGVLVGGQNCHAKPSGAHTGEIAAEMLRDCGASHVIVGHSERRADCGETDAIVRAKAEAAWRAGLLPIVCIGETLAEREAGKTLGVLEAQLKGSVPAGATRRQAGRGLRAGMGDRHGQDADHRRGRRSARAYSQGAGRADGRGGRGASSLWRLGEGQQCRRIAGGGRRRRRPGRRRQPQGGRIFGYRQGRLKRLEAPAAVTRMAYSHLALDQMDAVRGFLHDWRLVLLIIHVGVTAAMIVVILLQRSEGGGLGMGRTDALFSVRGQANVLSRMTAIFAGIFFFLSLVMAWSMTDPSRARALDHGSACRPRPPRPAAPGRRARRPRQRPRAPAQPSAPTR